MRSLLLCCFVVFASCRAADPTPDAEKLPERPRPTVVSATSLERNATGVTIDSSGQRFVWVRGLGVHKVTSRGAELTLNSTAFGMEADFEDLAMIDADRLAVVAPNEGFVVGANTGLQLSRFCYLPEQLQEGDPSATQRSRSLAFDPAANRLYVQPQTFTDFGTRLTSSQLGVFDPASSEPLEWQTIGDTNFSAGGMAVASRKSIYLGMNTRLYEYDAEARDFTNWWELNGIIRGIEGLALDRQAGTLVVLDLGQELVELKLE